MSWVFLVFLSQDPRTVRAAMQASLDQQRASIEQQARALRPAVVAVLVAAQEPASDCDPIPPPELARMIGDVSQKHGVDAGLVKEVARQESGFKPCVVSKAGAQGLMQLMPATQAQFAVADPFDPRESLEAGTKLLKKMLDRYGGDIQKALSAYNAGATRVDQAGGIPQIPETQNYVWSILARFAY